MEIRGRLKVDNNMEVTGSVNVVGTLFANAKSFQIQHPLFPDKKLVYGALEGPEYSVYIRGELKGNEIIELPEHWKFLVDEKSITITLSPIGKFQYLYVDKIENYKIYVKQSPMTKLLTKEIHCHYMVFGERKDIEKLKVEQ